MRAVGASIFIFGALFIFVGGLMAVSLDWGTDGLVGTEIFALLLASTGGGLYEYGRTQKINREQQVSQ